MKNYINLKNLFEGNIYIFIYFQNSKFPYCRNLLHILIIFIYDTIVLLKLVYIIITLHNM